MTNSARTTAPSSPPSWTTRIPGQEPEWIVWVTLVVGLLIGWLIMTMVVGRTTTATVGTATLSYPARWAKVGEQGAAFAATDVESGDPFSPRVMLFQTAQRDLMPRVGTLADAATTWSIKRGNGLDGYRVLSIEPVTVNGHAAINVASAYLMEPPRSRLAGTMPALMREVDTLVASGDQYMVLAFAADSTQFDGYESLHRQLLSGWGTR